MEVSDVVLVGAGLAAGAVLLSGGSVALPTTLPAQPVGSVLGNSVGANGPVNTSYEPWSANAVSWLRKMGYTSDLLGDSVQPSAATMQQVLRSHPVVVYWLMHGAFVGVQPWGCPQSKIQCLTARMVAESTPVGPKGKLAFLGSCQMMNGEDLSNQASAAANGDIVKIMLNSYEVVVGYYNMEKMGRSWQKSLQWQDDFFSSLATGTTMGEAYNYAQSRAWSGTGVDDRGNPVYLDLSNHIKIKGNLNTRLVN